MNVRDEDKTDLERGTEAGSDEETDEDRETDGLAAVPAGPHGMFSFSVHINSSAGTDHVTQ